MNSKQINALVRKLDGADTYDSFAGKVVPYIGWFWRDVDFDAPSVEMGVIPAGMEEIGFGPNTKPLIGFMQNNKWDYDTIHVEGQDWQNIKDMLVLALESGKAEDFETLNNIIQGLYERL